MKGYAVTRMLLAGNLEAVGIPLEVRLPDNMIGFIPVYKDLKSAEEYANGAEVLLVSSLEEKT